MYMHCTVCTVYTSRQEWAYNWTHVLDSHICFSHTVKKLGRAYRAYTDQSTVIEAKIPLKLYPPPPPFLDPNTVILALAKEK
jgi:hypothetical protein